MSEKNKVFILLAVSILVSLLFLELVLAYLFYPTRYGENWYKYIKKTRIYAFHPVVGYLPTANLNIKKPKPTGTANAPRKRTFWDVQTNEFGFRYNGALVSPKPKGEVRVFCLGGSTTFGAEVPNRWTYPQVVNDKFDDASIKVINAGVGGFRSINLVKLYEEVIRDLEPDFITIYSGWNDYEDFILGYWQPQDPHKHALYSQLMMDKSFINKSSLGHSLLALYYRIRKYNRLDFDVGSEKVIKEYNEAVFNQKWHEEYRKNIQQLIHSSRRDGVEPILVLFPSPQFDDASVEVKEYAENDIAMAGRWDALVKALGVIRSILKEIAERNNVMLIDVNSEMEKQNKNYKEKFLYFTDRMHLTKAGNVFVAENMYGPLREKIVSLKKKLKK